jgi:hypothetical protein
VAACLRPQLRQYVKAESGRIRNEMSRTNWFLRLLPDGRSRLESVTVSDLDGSIKSMIEIGAFHAHEMPSNERFLEPLD